MGNIHIVGPNEALIISGGCCRPSAKVMVVGGWTWTWCCVTDVQKLSLEVMTISPKCENVETVGGVPLTVTGVAQCKVMTDKEHLAKAAEQFLGKGVSHIKTVILQTLEGHLRAIVGTQTVEQIYQDRDQFATLVREVAGPAVDQMGIEVLSFTIKDIFDQVDYLASLGKSKIAEIKKNATVGIAQAEKIAGMKESECERLAMLAKYDANVKIEDKNRDYLKKKAEYDNAVNAKKAEAESAYQLQAAKMQQAIRKAQLEIELTEKKGQILVEDQEIVRKGHQLKAEVEMPADAEAYKIEKLAEASSTQIKEKGLAEAKEMTKMGTATASAIMEIGNAEATGMRKKAAAFKQYEEAAILSLTLEALPKVAAEITAPLSRTNEVVIMGGSTAISGDLTRLAAQIPPAVAAVSGVDLKKIFFSKKDDK